MTLWVRQKKPVKLGTTLAPEDLESDQDIGGNTAGKTLYKSGYWEVFFKAGGYY